MVTLSSAVTLCTMCLSHVLIGGLVYTKCMSKFRAFTLIELLVTIAIISLLTGVAAVSYEGVRQRSRDAERINELNQLKIILTSYYQARTPQRYPISTSKITINNNNDALSSALKPNYTTNVPLDPINSGNTVYKYQSNTSGTSGTSYTLYGTLENKNNSLGWAGGSSWVADGLRITSD